MAAEVPNNQVKTRSQAKKAKDQAPSEIQCPTKPEEQTGQTSPTEEKIPDFEKLSFPLLDNIKNTVSIGRGSTEGAERGELSTGSGTEAPSFAPAGFQFTAPSGINTFTYFSKTFKFQPLSPNSAAEFMCPSSAASFFSPKREKATEQKQVENAIIEDPVAACHLNNEQRAQESNQQQQCDQEMKDDAAETCSVAMETCDGSEKQKVVDDDSASNACSADAEIPNTQQPSEAAGEVVTGMNVDDVVVTRDVGEEQHDATYFRNLVRTETDRLNEICAKWEKINAEETDLSEEGMICNVSQLLAHYSVRSPPQRPGKWGEVKSKHEEPGKNRNESVGGGGGGGGGLFTLPVVPHAPSPPTFNFSCYFALPHPLKEPLWRRELSAGI